MEKRTNPTQLKTGDRLSRVSYVEVVKTPTRREPHFTLRNQEGLVWDISGSIIENEMYSAGQFDETKKVSRTELIEKLENAGDTIFTVIFDKKVNQKDLVDQLYSQKGSLPRTKTALNKVAREMLAGQERTLVGYLVTTEAKMGRSTVIDLEIEAGKHPLRLVDHRTVKALILRNVRYVLKK